MENINDLEVIVINSSYNYIPNTVLFILINIIEKLYNIDYNYLLDEEITEQNKYEMYDMFLYGSLIRIITDYIDEEFNVDNYDIKMYVNKIIKKLVKTKQDKLNNLIDISFEDVETEFFDRILEESKEPLAEHKEYYETNQLFYSGFNINDIEDYSRTLLYFSIRRIDNYMKKI